MIPLDVLEQGEETGGARNGGGASLAIQILILIVTLLNLLGLVSQGALWFRIAVTAFSAAVGIWVGTQLWPNVRGLWTRYTGKRRLEASARALYRNFLNLVIHFKRYTQQERYDNIPAFLNKVSQQWGVDLPLGDTSAYHVWRLYETLIRRLPRGSISSREFKSVVQEFGNVLEVCHRLYVVRPSDKLRSLASVSPSVPQTFPIGEFEVYREEYNAFLRQTNEFGSSANGVFGENLFPAHVEPVQPLRA